MQTRNQSSINTGLLVLHERDHFGIRELLSSDHYLYALSVILSEAFHTGGGAYDYKLIYDLLSGQKTQTYAIEVFDVILSDIGKFATHWAETTTHYADEHTELIQIFDTVLHRFCVEKHFDRLKNHRLKDRIHRPLLAVLKSRAKEWKKNAPPSGVSKDILDILY